MPVNTDEGFKCCSVKHPLMIIKSKRCPRGVDINNLASQPQCENDPGTTKLLDGNKGPPGQKCPLGHCVKKEEDQNQALDLETAAEHQCSVRYGAAQGPLWQESPC